MYTLNGFCHFHKCRTQDLSLISPHNLFGRKQQY